MLGISGARVVPADFSLAKAHEQFDEQGVLASGQALRLAGVLDQLLGETSAIAA